MIALIGYTGFVGQNLANQTTFNKLYNTKNLSKIKEQEYNLVVCAGIKAEKFLANKNPKQDLENILNLLNALKSVKTKQLVLISTIDVYPYTLGVDEDTKINKEILSFYGKHRFLAEEFVNENFNNFLIVRLPALFGNGLKKNFLFDLINKIPSIIFADKYLSLPNKELLDTAYCFNSNHQIYTLKQHLPSDLKVELSNYLSSINFSSLNFTHSDSCFQFYNLANLWKDITRALTKKISIINLTSPPISAKELAKELDGIDFVNKLAIPPLKYDIYSKYSTNNTPYTYHKADILKDLKDFYLQHNKVK